MAIIRTSTEPEPAPVDGWLPDLASIPFGRLLAAADAELAEAADRVAAQANRPFATIAGSSGS